MNKDWTGNSKTCTVCKEIKPLSDFYWHKSTNRYCSECKECTRKRSKRYRVEHPDKIREMRQNYKERRKEIRYKTDRNAHLKRKYKISESDYKVMYENQNGCCLICGIKKEYGKLCIDHSHQNGNVRGLLCSSCNFAIGLLKDDVKLVKRVISYLEKV